MLTEGSCFFIYFPYNSNSYMEKIQLVKLLLEVEYVIRLDKGVVIVGFHKTAIL